MSGYRIVGEDIGANENHVGLVQEEQGIAQEKFPAAAQASKEQTILELMAGIERLPDIGVAGIGIGVPIAVMRRHWLLLQRMACTIIRTFPFMAVTDILDIELSDPENPAVLGAAALFQLKAEPNLQPLNVLS